MGHRHDKTVERAFIEHFIHKYRLNICKLFVYKRLRFFVFSFFAHFINFFMDLFWVLTALFYVLGLICDIMLSWITRQFSGKQ